MTNSEKVEEEIYEYICVAHPGLQRASLPEFIDSADKVIEHSGEEEEQRILDIYERAQLHESDTEADDTPDVPPICNTATLEGMEALPTSKSPCQCTKRRAASGSS